MAKEIKSIKIIAPAGPGGGYDQLARATQEILTGEKIAASVQVVNVPGAGGTIGLAQFINSKERDPSLMVAGLGLVGATFINKSPVSLNRPRRLRGCKASISRSSSAATRRSRTVGDLIAKFKEIPARSAGADSLSVLPTTC